MQKPITLNEVERGFLNAAWDPSRWPEALQLASSAIGAAGSNLLPLKGTAPAVVWSPAVEELAHYFFDTGWYLRDERQGTIPKILSTGIAVDFDYTTPEQMEGSAYYQDFLGKFGFRYFAGLRIDAGDDIWALTIQRKISEGPFSLSEQRRIARWRQRLSNCATLTVELGKAHARGVTNVFELLGKPAILLDRFGQIIDLNSPAEKLLQSGLTLKNNKLGFDDRTASAHLNQILRAMLQPSPKTKTFGPVLANREFLPALSVTLVGLTGQDINPFAQARILVLVNDLASRPLAKAEQLGQMFGLTPAEARLAEALSSGGGLRQVADELGVSHETGRTHLKRLFAKTGVNHQSALVALIAKLGGGSGF